MAARSPLVIWDPLYRTSSIQGYVLQRGKAGRHTLPSLALCGIHGLGATHCLLGHPLPLETLVGISAPAHSPLPPDEKPSLDSQDVLVAHSARSHGRGTLKKPLYLFATRCLLGHPPFLWSRWSASLPLPHPPLHTLLMRRSGS